MPRASLSHHLKNLHTYGVLLTQTTEQDLLDHFKKASEVYEARHTPFYDELSKTLEKQYETNPYRHANWRKCAPTRKFKIGFEWNRIDLEDERKYEAYQWLTYVQRDLMWCDKEFHWSQKPDTEKWVREFQYLMERCRTTMNDLQKELVELDARNFAVAKAEWERDDAEWIDRAKRLREHQSHRSRQYYLDEVERDPDALAWYEARGGIPNHEETCEFCKEKKQKEDAWLERQRIEEANLREQERLEEEQRKADAEKLKAMPRLTIPRVLHRCEDCDYQTYTKPNYDIHMNSREHAHRVKQKALHCAVCETQCRTQSEFDNHIKSAKHKKLSSGPASKSLHCEVCNYTASLRHHFEAHLVSKKHLAKVGSSEAEQVVEIPVAGAN